MDMIEAAQAAILDDLRDRKMLKYLFAENPETRGAYGYVDAPIDTATQNEIAESLTRAVLRAMREPSEAMKDKGSVELCRTWTDPWDSLSDEEADILALPKDDDDLATYKRIQPLLTDAWQAMIDVALGEE